MRFDARKQRTHSPTPAMRMVFEIESLRNCHPATVSRAGILFINETDIGWAPFATSWTERRESEIEKSCLPGFFDKYVPQLISLLKEKGIEYLTPVMTISKVSALCHLLEGYLSAVPESDKDGHRIERLFLYACIWAFGGCAAADKTTDSRQLFNEAGGAAKSALKLQSGLCFEYAVDPASVMSVSGASWCAHEPVGLV